MPAALTNITSADCKVMLVRFCNEEDFSLLHTAADFGDFDWGHLNEGGGRKKKDKGVRSKEGMKFIWTRWAKLIDSDQQPDSFTRQGSIYALCTCLAA